jgi:hypothetical protein
LVEAIVEQSAERALGLVHRFQKAATCSIFAAKQFATSATC